MYAMQTRTILASAEEMPLIDQLKADGYLVLRGAVDPRAMHEIHDDLRDRFARTPFCKGDFYGTKTKRFGALLKRSPLIADIVLHKMVNRVAELVLGPHCDRVQLNLTQALQIHPGEMVQAPHRDQDMYWAPKGAMEYLFNVMWPFTPYTAQNGATRIYVASNHRLELGAADLPPPIAIEMDPGDALIFLGSTLHGAGANRSAAPRTGMIMGYGLGWLKPYENQWLAYPPQIARHFAPELAALVGYAQHRPNLGNYEGQCPSVLLREEDPDYLEAVDDVTEDQRAALAAFKQQQAANQAA